MFDLNSERCAAICASFSAAVAVGLLAAAGIYANWVFVLFAGVACIGLLVAILMPASGASIAAVAAMVAFAYQHDSVSATPLPVHAQAPHHRVTTK